MKPSEELNKGYEFTKAQIAELESLRAENAKLKADVAAEVVQQIAEGEIWKELETLRARLAELEKQEPVAHIVKTDDGEELAYSESIFKYRMFNSEHIIADLFAAPAVSPDVEKLKAEIVSLRQQICASQSNVMARDEYIQSITTELVAVLKDAEHKQCRIDELILEFCPSEMTADQLNRWRKCQIPAIEQAKGGA